MEKQYVIGRSHQNLILFSCHNLCAISNKED